MMRKAVQRDEHGTPRMRKNWGIKQMPPAKPLEIE